LNKIIIEKTKDAIQSIVPVALIILAISIFVGTPGSDLLEFGIGAIMLIAGLILFSLGAETAMMAIAEKIGSHITTKRKIGILVVIGFIIGFLITVAEPDLWVLAEQFVAIPSLSLIFFVAIGVGVFLVISLLRITFQIKMSLVIMISYGILFLIAFFVPAEFVPVAFDSGGVTTGPITVPFIIALGLGVSSVRGDSNSREDSFGLVGICSIGPILAVLILGLFHNPSYSNVSESLSIWGYLLKYTGEIALALVPFLLFFLIFQFFVFKLPKRKAIRILIGFLYTFVGLVLFLAGANAGFLSIGSHLGYAIASMEHNYLLIPIGMLFGFTIVVAEPAVTVLTHQVEEMSSGAIPRRVMNISLSIGVSLAVGLACLRVWTGISIWYIILPGYLIAILLTLFVPQFFTAIAFDSGGSASGAMTATFLVPFATGAASALGSNVLTDAFGLVALVALAPLVTIQLLGLIYKTKGRKTGKTEDVGEDEIITISEVHDETANDNH
jgi:hypothetical protein